MYEHQGKVISFNDEKGCGFLSRITGSDIFVHYSAIEGEHGRKSLVAGDNVEFDVTLGHDDKEEAAHVHLLPPDLPTTMPTGL
jgi:CspA family cold shock protein